MARPYFRTESLIRFVNLVTVNLDWAYASRRLKRLWNGTNLQAPVLSAGGPVRCREMVASDLDDVTNILTRAFDRFRDRDYWERAVKRLQEHRPPPGLPKYGYVLESQGTIVGVLFTIFFPAQLADGSMGIRCNGGSLFVEAPFRSFASLLIRQAERRKGITYLNITAGSHTWPLVEAQGFKRYAEGQFVAIPTLCNSQARGRVQVREATPEIVRDDRLTSFDKDVLLTHATYGCLCLLCEWEGKLYPFVFGRRKKYGIPGLHLLYCRNRADFVALARPMGRLLLRRGFPLVVLDANGPIPGLVGKYLDIGPKYWRGQEAPRLGDLAYTELAMFGF